MMICEFCGYEFSDDLGRYGCPNSEGEGLMTNLYDNILAESRDAVIAEAIENADACLNNVAIPNYSDLVSSLVVKVEVRNVYGNATIYPANAAAERFAAIAGKKTLSNADLTNIQALGFKVEEVAAKKLAQFRSAVGVEPGMTAEMEASAAGEFPILAA